MQRILLVGYMGSGKSTVGKELAKEIGLQFYDLDKYIENRMHKTIMQIFQERGEDGFRKLEHSLLHEVAEFENVVISCGGGTPCFFDNMDYMLKQGQVVYLKVPPEILNQYLIIGKTNRPLLKDKSEKELLDTIINQVNERSPFYEKAQTIIDVNSIKNYDKVKTIVEKIKEELCL